MPHAVLKPKPATEKPDTGLSKDGRREVAEHLSAVLTDTYFLTIKSHVYHWNVVGPMFHAIHVLTEEHYSDLFAAADVIAERIRALGFHAPIADAAGPDKAVVSLNTSAKSAHDMVADLIDEHEATIRRMRDAAEVAEGHEDFVSHDMLVARLTFHEKAVWMLRALVTE
ncbi:Dps family protein [Oricola thermophila]|uniref:DNA starvation/stationary phase protection protein n=1 Tax=Oricola thermophila TaxID=2742145 RepID=A0A6N1VI67_9HYPH|nr:DNA starvation/stationary phase protection protein [Oricola thermophila]QKV19032.1 DNA starvation/stationary phase protection protein [Oricola thermophila]